VQQLAIGLKAMAQARVTKGDQRVRRNSNLPGFLRDNDSCHVGLQQHPAEITQDLRQIHVETRSGGTIDHTVVPRQ